MAAVIPFVLGGFGVLSLVRGLFRPHRAVLREGTVRRCAGANQFKICDPTDTIDAPQGTASYAVSPGRVVAVGESFVQLLASNDAAILTYDGIEPDVVEGQHVGRGQRLGLSIGPVHFGVWQFVPSDRGPIMQNVPPAAWLAARGMRHVVTNTGAADKWCDGGRKIDVPPAVRKACDFRQPDPSRFGLLAVEVNMAE